MPAPLRFWQSLTLNSSGRVATTFLGLQWQKLFDFTVLNGAADSPAGPRTKSHIPIKRDLAPRFVNSATILLPICRIRLRRKCQTKSGSKHLKTAEK